MTGRPDLFDTDDPLRLARRWLDEASAVEINDPNAMALATVDAGGMPNVRMVLLKDLGPGGMTFYTNTQSTKGAELAGQPMAAAVLHWKSLRRQLRFRGTVQRRDGAEADAYYSSRALGSRIGAWASRQSQPLASRSVLEEAVAREAGRHGTDPARPPFWGGYCIVPVEIEFWADGANRLHDRFRWRRDAPGLEWRVERLYP